MTAKEIVFGNTREITSCSSEIDFLCFSFLYAFSFFSCESVCTSQRRISSYNSETAEASLSFFVL